MRSSSEIRWVRVKNTVNQSTRVSDWHAVIPGKGVGAPPPGVACGTALTGSQSWASHEGVKTLDGKRHDNCMALAEGWIAGLDTTPGALVRPPDRVVLKGPKP